MQRSYDIQLLPFPHRTSLSGVLHHVEPLHLRAWLVQSFYLVIVELYQVIPNLEVYCAPSLGTRMTPCYRWGHRS
jgi:hypothetical protein